MSEKAHMWLVDFHNLDYCGQDMSGAIESYHGFAKSILEMKRRIISRRVDWCIITLMEDVLNHYWYKDLHKDKVFVDNKKL